LVLTGYQSAVNINKIILYNKSRNCVRAISCVGPIHPEDL
jgi:hypothetical protein